MMKQDSVEKSMVTLKDIAAEAGVSITTVSNVVHNRKSRVSPERVKKIWEIIEREHYVPSMSARSLANDHSFIIGVITHLTPQNTGSTMSDPFLSSFVDSIEKRTREEGYYLMIRAVRRAGRPLPQLAAVRADRDRHVPGYVFHGYQEPRHPLRADRQLCG